jgi:hypothetical protein
LTNGIQSDIITVTRERKRIMSTIEVMGMAEEGTCQHCGTNCPRRRVAVRAVYADGSTGEVEFWGVVCAGSARYGRRTATNGNRVRQEAEHADRVAELDRLDRERRFAYRVAGEVPVEGGPRNAANLRYRRTGRPIVGSYFLADDAGRIVRVDGTDPADVKMFADRGFTTPASSPVQPTSIPA